MEERKGVRVIMQAALQLAAEGKISNIHFVICGNKHNEADAYLAMLENSPAKLHATFAGYRNDIAELMRSSSVGVIASTGWNSFTMPSVEMMAIDLFLMPSSDEGLGMTLIEAAACGCIPIASRVGGMQEILCGQLDKYLCTPNDIREWVKTTSSLLPEAQRQEQQKIIYADLHKRFDANTQWGLMVDWLEKTCDQQAA